VSGQQFLDPVQQVAGDQVGVLAGGFGLQT
jgi:hypothetical protein